MKTKAKPGEQWAEDNAEGGAMCDRALGEMCYALDAPRAVALVREMARRMEAGEDGVAVGFLYRLAQRTI